MDSQKVDMYIMSNSKFFEGSQIPYIREQLLQMDENKWVMLSSLNLKDPTIMLVVSLIAGGFGIDRFMMGDTGLGVAKLLTCGGFGIWSIVDWFTVMGRAKELNMNRLQGVL